MSAQIIAALRSRAAELRKESKYTGLPPSAQAFKANLAVEFDALAEMAERGPGPEQPVYTAGEIAQDARERGWPQP